MNIIKVTKEYFETKDEKVYFFEPLDKVISAEDMQKIAETFDQLMDRIYTYKYAGGKK